MTDKLIEAMHYRVNNPSAWPEGFDQEASDLFAAAVLALTTAHMPVTDEMIERLARFNCPHPWDEISPMVRASYRLSAQSMLHAALSALEGEGQ